LSVSDRTSAGVILMGVAVAAGWWYWRLTPGQRQERTEFLRRGGAPLVSGAAAAPSGGLSVAPPGPEPLYHNNPAIGKDGLTDAERGHPGIRGRLRSALPFDAGEAIAQIFGGLA
jgi:hypothetical protein